MVHAASTCPRAVAEIDALIGLPFDDSDDAIRAAIAEACVPAALMSMVP
jgi:4-hydroxyacetophenone monooxygenase